MPHFDSMNAPGNILPVKTYKKVLLSRVSCSYQESKNITWKIPKMNKSYIESFKFFKLKSHSS